MGHSTNLLVLRAGLSFKWRIFFVSSHFINYYYDLNLAYNLSYKYLYYLFKFKYNIILLKSGLIFAFMRIKNNNLQSNYIRIFLYDSFYYKRILNRFHSNYKYKIVRPFLSLYQLRKYKRMAKWQLIQRKRRQNYERLKKLYLSKKLHKDFVFRYNAEFEAPRRFYDFGPAVVRDPLLDVYKLLLKKNIFLYSNPLQVLSSSVKYRDFIVPFDFKLAFRNNNMDGNVKKQIPYYKKRALKKSKFIKFNLVSKIVKSALQRKSFFNKPLNFFLTQNFLRLKKFKSIRKRIFRALHKKYLFKFNIKNKRTFKLKRLTSSSIKKLGLDKKENIKKFVISKKKLSTEDFSIQNFIKNFDKKKKNKQQDNKFKGKLNFVDNKHKVGKLQDNDFSMQNFVKNFDNKKSNKQQDNKFKGKSNFVANKHKVGKLQDNDFSMQNFVKNFDNKKSNKQQDNKFKGKSNFVANKFNKFNKWQDNKFKGKRNFVAFKFNKRQDDKFKGKSNFADNKYKVGKLQDNDFSMQNFVKNFDNKKSNKQQDNKFKGKSNFVANKFNKFNKWQDSKFKGKKKYKSLKKTKMLFFNYRKSLLFRKFKFIVSDYVFFDKFRTVNYYLLNNFFKDNKKITDKFHFFKKQLDAYSKFKVYRRNRKNIKKVILAKHNKKPVFNGLALSSFFNYNLYSLTRFFKVIKKFRRMARVSRFYLAKKSCGKLFYKMNSGAVLQKRFKKYLVRKRMLKKNRKRLSLKPRLLRRLFYNLYLKSNKRSSFISRRNDFMSYFNFVVSRVFYKNLFCLPMWSINKVFVPVYGNKKRRRKIKIVRKFIPGSKRRISFNRKFIIFLIRLVFKIRFTKMYDKYKRIRAVKRTKKFVYSFMSTFLAMKKQSRKKNISKMRKKKKQKKYYRRFLRRMLRVFTVCLFYKKKKKKKVSFFSKLLARIHYLFRIYKSWFFYKFYKKFVLRCVLKNYQSLAMVFKTKLNLFLKSFGYCSKFELKLFPLAPAALSLDLLALFIDWKLKKKFTLNQIIYPFFRQLERSQNYYVRGLAIKAAGRFTRKQRAGLKRYVRGRLTYSSFRSLINFSFYRVITKYGSCGLKLWVNINKRRLRKKYNKKLYLIKLI